MFKYSLSSSLLPAGSKTKFAVVFIIFTSFFCHLKSQQVTFSKPREIGILGGSALWSVANLYAGSVSPLIPKHFYSARPTGIDKFSAYSYSRESSKFSDITAVGTILLSASLLAYQPKETWMRNGFVFAETLWITANVTQTIKLTVLRPRPYTRDYGFTFTKKDDFYSFVSGHSSLIAAAITSLALLQRGNTPVLSHYSKKWGIVSVGILGATTAAFRVFAGKHYPTDVLAGILTGIGIAYINYKIHEK